MMVEKFVNATTKVTKQKLSRLVTCLLSSERTTLSQPCLSTSRLTQDGRAASTDNDRLSVRVDCSDGKAAGAFDIHEEGSRSRDKVL